MKLKNKKTGEIVEFETDIYADTEDRTYEFRTIAELNAEWEDAPEEPKEYWYINEFGTPTKADFVGRETLYGKCRKNFGNHFETKEEAEKAVEKLKAWKRLKDTCNLQFDGIERDNSGMLKGVKLSYDRKNVPFEIAQDRIKDLLLLFGGK